jgi:hypothetical protein
MSDSLSRNLAPRFGLFSHVFFPPQPWIIQFPPFDFAPSTQTFGACFSRGKSNLSRKKREKKAKGSEQEDQEIGL